MDFTSAQWRTSSYSGGNGGQCIQVAVQPSTLSRSSHLYAVRDSKAPAGPALVFGFRQWLAFTTSIKAGAI